MHHISRFSLVVITACFITLTGCERNRYPTSVVAEGVGESRHLLASELSNGRAKLKFQLANQSSTPVVLELVLVSCECADVVVDEKPVRLRDQLHFDQGERKTIDFLVKSPPVSGIRSVTAALREKGREPLWLTGAIEVHDDVRCIPASVIIDDLNSYVGEITKLVRVNYTYRGSEAEGHRLSVITAPQDIRVRDSISKAVHLVDDLYRAEWNCIAHVPRRVGRGNITFGIYRGLERRPVQVVQLPVVVRSLPAIVAPVSVGFGIGAPGVSRRRTFSLLSRDGSPFSILSVHATSTAYTVTASEGRAQEHWIDVHFTPTEAGSHSGSLRIDLDRPDMPSVEIGIHGYASS